MSCVRTVAIRTASPRGWTATSTARAGPSTVTSLFASYEDHGLARVGVFRLDGTMTEAASGTDLSFSVSRSGDIAYAGALADRPAEVTFAASWRQANAPHVAQ